MEGIKVDKKAFLNRLCNGEADIIQELLNLLKRMEIDYCVIGGLAVNAYVDPVVSLDLDIVVVSLTVSRNLWKRQEMNLRLKISNIVLI